MNINSLIKIAKTLDSNGKFILADKIDSFIKISQEATPSTVTQLPGRPARFNIPGMFGNALSPESLRGGTQGFQYLDPNDPFYDPIRGALFKGVGPDQAYVNKDFITGKDYLKGMETSQGQLDLYNKIRQQLETQQSTFSAPYAAQGRIDQEISFLIKTLQRYQNNPYEAYRTHKNNLVAVLREALANQSENQWSDTIQYFKGKMPANMAVQANEVANQAKQEAIARQQSKGIKTKETSQSLMTNPEVAAPETTGTAPVPPPAPAAQAPTPETPQQRTIEGAKYGELLSNFRIHLNNNDVNSMIAVRNLAKQTFKNPERFTAFKTQTDQLAQQKGINISTF